MKQKIASFPKYKAPNDPRLAIEPLAGKQDLKLTPMEIAMLLLGCKDSSSRIVKLDPLELASLILVNVVFIAWAILFSEEEK